MFVRVLDETTTTELHAFMALDAMIDRSTDEYATADEALSRWRRYWYFDDAANVMYYLTPAEGR